MTKVKYLCNHTVEVEDDTPGKLSKIRFNAEKSKCPECRKAIGCIPMELPYGLYKTSYFKCRTKTGSYNSQKHSIIVYISENEAPTNGREGVPMIEAIQELIKRGVSEIHANQYVITPASVLRNRMKNIKLQRVNEILITLDYLKTHYIIREKTFTPPQYSDDEIKSVKNVIPEKELMPEKIEMKTEKKLTKKEFERLQVDGQMSFA